MRILVVIPAHNEVREIARVVAPIVRRGLDVVVIDDGSEDETAEAASQAGAVVLQNDPRGGKGFSLKRGFRYAIDHGFDGVIMMDGDGQHAVEDLEGFLKKAKESPQSVINGNRMATPQGMPLIRWLTNWFMSSLISLICGQRIPDTQCGYRYISTDILKQLHLVSDDFEIESEILTKASKQRFPVLSVGIRTIYGEEESKIRPLQDTLRFFRYLFRELRKGMKR